MRYQRCFSEEYLSGGKITFRYIFFSRAPHLKEPAGVSGLGGRAPGQGATKVLRGVPPPDCKRPGGPTDFFPAPPPPLLLGVR